MLAALAEEFPEGSHWTVPEGGFFVWATLPAPVHTGDLLVKAIEENVAFVRGDAFYMDGQGTSSMRLNVQREHRGAHPGGRPSAGRA